MAVEPSAALCSSRTRGMSGKKDLADKHGGRPAWMGGNGGIPLLDVDFTSFTFILADRTNAFAVSLSSSSKQLTNIFFAILVDCGYMVRPRNTSMGSGNSKSLAVNSNISRPLLG